MRSFIKSHRKSQSTGSSDLPDSSNSPAPTTNNSTSTTIAGAPKSNSTSPVIASAAPHPYFPPAQQPFVKRDQKRSFSSLSLKSISVQHPHGISSSGTFSQQGPSMPLISSTSTASLKKLNPITFIRRRRASNDDNTEFFIPSAEDYKEAGSIFGTRTHDWGSSPSTSSPVFHPTPVFSAPGQFSPTSPTSFIHSACSTVTSSQAGSSIVVATSSASQEVAPMSASGSKYSESSYTSSSSTQSLQSPVTPNSATSFVKPSIASPRVSSDLCQVQEEDETEDTFVKSLSHSSSLRRTASIKAGHSIRSDAASQKSSIPDLSNSTTLNDSDVDCQRPPLSSCASSIDIQPSHDFMQSSIVTQSTPLPDSGELEPIGNIHIEKNMKEQNISILDESSRNLDTEATDKHAADNHAILEGDDDKLLTTDGDINTLKKELSTIIRKSMVFENYDDLSFELQKISGQTDQCGIDIKSNINTSTVGASDSRSMIFNASNFGTNPLLEVSTTPALCISKNTSPAKSEHFDHSALESFNILVGGDHDKNNNNNNNNQQKQEQNTLSSKAEEMRGELDTNEDNEDASSMFSFEDNSLMGRNSSINYHKPMNYHSPALQQNKTPENMNSLRLQNMSGRKMSDMFENDAYSDLDNYVDDSYMYDEYYNQESNDEYIEDDAHLFGGPKLMSNNNSTNPLDSTQSAALKTPETPVRLGDNNNNNNKHASYFDLNQNDSNYSPASFKKGSPSPLKFSYKGGLHDEVGLIGGLSPSVSRSSNVSAYNHIYKTSIQNYQLEDGTNNSIYHSCDDDVTSIASTRYSSAIDYGESIISGELDENDNNEDDIDYDSLLDEVNAIPEDYGDSDDEIFNKSIQSSLKVCRSTGTASALLRHHASSSFDAFKRSHTTSGGIPYFGSSNTNNNNNRSSLGRQPSYGRGGLRKAKSYSFENKSQMKGITRQKSVIKVNETTTVTLFSPLSRDEYDNYYQSIPSRTKSSSSSRSSILSMSIMEDEEIDNFTTTTPPPPPPSSSSSRSYKMHTTTNNKESLSKQSSTSSTKSSCTSDESFLSSTSSTKSAYTMCSTGNNSGRESIVSNSNSNSNSSIDSIESIKNIKVINNDDEKDMKKNISIFPLSTSFNNDTNISSSSSLPIEEEYQQQNLLSCLKLQEELKLKGSIINDLPTPLTINTKRNYHHHMKYDDESLTPISERSSSYDDDNNTIIFHLQQQQQFMNENNENNNNNDNKNNTQYIKI